MNWDALGAVGEMVGAFAVVITLAYLALQIRFTRRDLQAQGTERSMGFWSVWRTTLLDNSDLAQTVAKANQGEVLTEQERIQLEILTDELFYGASIAYSRAIHSGAIHDPEDDPDYLIALFRSNPCFVDQWRRFRPFVDTISIDYGRSVDNRLGESEPEGPKP